jgi:hypothetical protein
MRSESKDYFNAALFFTAMAFLSFRLYFQNTGFYLDDWVILEKTGRAGGIWGAIKIFADGHHLSRPLSSVQIPLIYLLFGQKIWAAQMFLFSLEVLEATFFYIFVRRLSDSHEAGLTAALVALIIPIRSIMHPWLATATIHISLVATLVSLITYLEGLKRDSKRLRLGAVVPYFAACLTYESVLFFPLALTGGRFARLRSCGLPAAKAAKITIRETLPFAYAAGAVIFWQRIGLGLFFDIPSKKMSFSFSHAADVYTAAFRCLSDQLASFWLLTGKDFFTQSSLSPILLWLVTSGGAVFLLHRWRGKDSEESPNISSLLGAAAALFVGGYAPYALSGNYAPTIVLQASRHNNAGAWAAGLLAAAALVAIRRSGRKKSARMRASLCVAGLAVIVGASTWANLQISRQWALSWRHQLNILSQTHKRLLRVPGPATVLLANAPKVFNLHFDFDAALRLSTKRSDRNTLTGAVVTPRLIFKEKTVEDTWNGEIMRTYDYGNLFLFDYSNGSFRRLFGPPSASDPKPPAGER